MSPKNEKRIFVFTKKMLCEHCKKQCEEYDGLQPDCDVCAYLELPHITRAEAVESMARAIAENQWNRLVSENDTFEAFFKRHKVAFDNSAEAALDALLGGDNA